MKWLKYAFSILGFSFQYIIPIILFGGVIPYTHDGISAGLTKMGYIAIIVICIIIGKKIKEKLLMQPKSLVRGIFLSLFPVAAWFVVNVCLNWIVAFIGDLSAYWDRIILFVALGRVFYVIEEVLSEKSVENGKI